MRPARTKPDEARAFVEATGVDALAVAVGTSHAMTERRVVLDLELIGALRSALPVPLVLHGSSGVADEELVRAVEGGMTKINIATHLIRVLPNRFEPRWPLIQGWLIVAATYAQLGMPLLPKPNDYFACSAQLGSDDSKDAECLGERPDRHHRDVSAHYL
jgi:hypothetical protein